MFLSCGLLPHTVILLLSPPSCLAGGSVFFSAFLLYTEVLPVPPAQLWVVQVFVTPITAVHFHSVYKYPTTIGRWKYGESHQLSCLWGHQLSLGYGAVLAFSIKKKTDVG